MEEVRVGERSQQELEKEKNSSCIRGFLKHGFITFLETLLISKYLTTIIDKSFKNSQILLMCSALSHTWQNLSAVPSLLSNNLCQISLETINILC